MSSRSSPRRRREVAMLVVILGAAALSIVAYATSLMRALELQSVDARFSVRGTQERPEDIVVVGIDDVTFDELEVQWPFPRSLHGRVIDRLREAGARVIAVDIQFTEPSADWREDNALIEAIARAPGVVLSTTEVDKAGRTRVLGGEEVLAEVEARAANTAIEPDPGGTFRKMHHSVDGLVSFPVAVAEAWTGETIEPGEMEGDGEAWIDYRGPPGTFRNVPYSRVLRGQVDSAFAGKTVIVGATAPSLQDVHPTSTTGDELMSGPEIQANAVWTAEHGFPLHSASDVVALLLILLMAAVPAAITLRLKPPWALAAAVALGLLYAAVAQLAFDADAILPVVYPLLALVLSALGALAVNYVMTAFERQRIRDTFGRFVPEAVVADVLARGEVGDLRFGGVRRECTVLFSDLRGFTSFSEALPPDRVIEVLNHYLEEMSDAIMDHGGTLVAYMGDGIMAVFGAPTDQPGHADRAVAAAREMLNLRLPRFNEWMLGQGYGEGFAMGIGLNSGTVMSGQVGSKRRIEYTAIGDTTNTAARLEGMTKGSGHQLFIAESTRLALEADPGDLELIGEREVRGRAHKITVWTLRGPRNPLAAPPPGDGASAGDDQRGEEEGDDVEGLVDGDPQPR